MHTSAALTKMLDAVAADDPRIAAAIATVGYPAPRKRPADFGALLRIIIGQQVSVAAARTIAARVWALMDAHPSPTKIAALSDDDLRQVGLSRQKIRYARSLSEEVRSGRLSLSALAEKSDEAVIESLTTVKGVGRWSAEMFLIFSLGRQDVWPVGDLGVREGVGRLLKLDARPSPAQTREIGAAWKPHRSAMALFSWHYLHNAPV